MSSAGVLSPLAGPRRVTLRCSALYGVLLTVLSACGAASPPQPVPATQRPRDLGALETLAPAESTSVLVLRPSALFDDPATSTVVLSLFPDTRLERFRVRTGVDPRRLELLVLVVHPEGRAVIARGPMDAPLAVMEAGARMAPLESSQDAPFPRRAGFLGSRRIELAAPTQNVLLWVEGTPALSAAVLHASGIPESERDHPFERAEVSELQEELGPAPFLMFSPHPLGLPLDQGVGVLLARERALAVAARSTGPGGLRVSAVMRGEFPPGATENFERLAHSIAASELGGALGLRQALPTYEVTATDDRVSASVEVRAELLAAGLRALLVAPLEELLESPPTAPLPESPDPEPSTDSSPSGEPSVATGGSLSRSGADSEVPPPEGRRHPPPSEMRSAAGADEHSVVGAASDANRPSAE